MCSDDSVIYGNMMCTVGIILWRDIMCKDLKIMCSEGIP
jgi:hypothetical protein